MAHLSVVSIPHPSGMAQHTQLLLGGLQQTVSFDAESWRTQYLGFVLCQHASDSTVELFGVDHNLLLATGPSW